MTTYILCHPAGRLQASSTDKDNINQAAKYFASGFCGRFLILDTDTQDYYAVNLANNRAYFTRKG